MRSPEWAGFSGRSIPITGNLLSEIEAEWYGPEIEFGMNEHPWLKVLDQCFVVRRSAYFQAGGFDPAFGHFAEWLLAARFSALGLKIGYAPTVRIHHVYIGDFGVWRRFTADFVHGQIAYLAAGAPRSTHDDVRRGAGVVAPAHAAAQRGTPGLPHAAARPAPIDRGRERDWPEWQPLVAATLALAAARIVARYEPLPETRWC